LSWGKLLFPPRHYEENVMSFLERLLSKIERFSHFQGLAVRWLILPLIFVLNYEIIARFVFNAPTDWAYDLTYFSYGALYMLGGAYTLLVDEHVRIEFLYMKFPKRTKSIVDIMGYLIFFFPIVIAYIVYGIGYTWESYHLQECAKESIWAPIIWPYKAVIPITAILLFLQGFAHFMRRILELKKGNTHE